MQKVYYVSFDFADGNRKNFTVDAMQFNALLEGETGMLTYKQNNENFYFEKFVPDLKEAES